MNYTKIILTLLFLLTCFTTVNSLNANELNKSKRHVYIHYDDPGTFRYERVFHDGFWWIVVYNSDGAKIDEFLDPVQ